MSAAVVELTAPERLYADVVAALGQLAEITADETATTPQYSYRYASLGSIMGHVRPVLAEHHLALSQLVTASDGLVSVATQLVHTSGLTFGAGALTMSAGVNAPAPAIAL